MPVDEQQVTTDHGNQTAGVEESANGTQVDPSTEPETTVDADKVVEKLQKRLGHEQAQKNDYKEQLSKAKERIEKLEKGEDPNESAEPDVRDVKIKELQAQIKRSETKQQTRSVLAEAGMNVPEDVLDMLIVDDDKITFSRAKALINYTTAVQEDVRKMLMKGVTPRAAGRTTRSLTKADIMKIKDPVERRNAIKDNYQNFIEGK